MLHVNDEKITTCRELNFDPKTYAGAVHRVAFCPINTAGLLVVPPADRFEPTVEDLTHSGTAVRILAFGDTEFKAG